MRRWLSTAVKFATLVMRTPTPTAVRSGAPSCSGFAPACGDGLVSSGEECDDGNAVLETCDFGTLNCTVCGPTCQFEPGIPDGCGDGNLDEGEVCGRWRYHGLAVAAWEIAQGLPCAEGTAVLGSCAPKGMPSTSLSQFVSAGEWHSCYVDSMGEVHCFGGYDEEHQVNAFDRGQIDVPEAGAQGVSYISSGRDHNCAIDLRVDRFAGVIQNFNILPLQTMLLMQCRLIRASPIHASWTHLVIHSAGVKAGSQWHDAGLFRAASRHRSLGVYLRSKW